MRASLSKWFVKEERGEGKEGGGKDIEGKHETRPAAYYRPQLDQ